MRARLSQIAVCQALAMIVLATSTRGADISDGWISLFDAKSATLEAWKNPNGWVIVGDVAISHKSEKALEGKEGQGTFFNGPGGRAANLISKESFGDLEFHGEFNVPKNSNSGVKFEGVYEIQIFDSYGIPKPTASHSGGIYPRAELLPRYHHIDEGFPPKVNAAKPPGEWQTLDVIFHAPKFDVTGKKTANAKFVKVLLNGQIVQENLEVPYPTGNVWREKEHPSGPILLQGDHGPVAFRNIKVKRLN